MWFSFALQQKGVEFCQEFCGKREKQRKKQDKFRESFFKNPILLAILLSYEAGPAITRLHNHRYRKRFGFDSPRVITTVVRRHVIKSADGDAATTSHHRFAPVPPNDRRCTRAGNKARATLGGRLGVACGVAWVSLGDRLGIAWYRLGIT